MTTSTQEAIIHRLILQDQAARLYFALDRGPVPLQREHTTYQVVTGDLSTRKVVVQLADSQTEVLEINEQEVTYLQAYCYQQLYEAYACRRQTEHDQEAPEAQATQPAGISDTGQGQEGSQLLTVPASAGRTPLEKMLQSFPAAHQKPNGYWTHEDNPRFDFYEQENGRIALYSWTGRSAEAVLAMGQPPLKLADLYPRTGESRPASAGIPEKQFDLFTLADYLKLDWRFLYGLGYRDGYTYRNKQGRRIVCVKLGGYCQPDGTQHSKVKVRLSIDGKVRFLWDSNTPGEPIPCGLHRLDQARTAGYLVIGEGESDAATMWFHGVPFVGISGADACKHLDVSLLRDIPCVYLIEEPDQAQKNSETGQGFYARMRSHLRENGYTGEICSIRWKAATGYKDPSNLHKGCYRECQGIDGLDTPSAAAVKAMFAKAFQKALDRAIPEGNQALGNQEDAVPDQMPAAPVEESDRLQWIAELCAMPQAVLSPTHKIVLLVILLHSPIWNAREECWWQVNADSLAPLAGVSPERFLELLSYLVDNLGLFTKRHRKIWYTPEEARDTKVRTELYIQPTEGTWRAYASTIRLLPGVAPRKIGGTRPSTESDKNEQQESAPAATESRPPVCDWCDSDDVEIYEALYCHTCDQTSYHWKGNDQPFHRNPDPDLEAVEGTASVFPLTGKPGEWEEEAAANNTTGILPKTSENTPGKGNLPPLVSFSIQRANLGQEETAHSEGQEEILLDTEAQADASYATVPTQAMEGNVTEQPIPRRQNQAEGELSPVIVEIRRLDEIKAYGQAHDWPAFEVDGKEVIPAGRSNWLQFVWLKGQKELQRRVYAAIRQER